jgi:hypothetical protein
MTRSGDQVRTRSNRRAQDLGEALKWIGFALLGTYVVTVVAAALPVRLLDPAWISRVCGSLRGGVSFPLEAVALFLIGGFLDRSVKEPPRVTFVRGLSSLAALGFLLLIPLQSWAGLKLIDSAIEAQKARLVPADNALRAVYAATNADQLMEAIRSIPGAPPNIGGRFEEPVPKVRERLISEIEPQVRQQREQLKEVIGTIRRDSLINLVKDGVVSLLSALAFAAVGRSKPHRSTLLQKLLGPSRPSSSASDEFEKLAEEYQREDDEA